MEHNIMKITELKINKLHGCTDYDVKFNDDITFLYGDNGCGKTTILNIITYIITGKIYELFRYRFESVVLHFISATTHKEKRLLLHITKTVLYYIMQTRQSKLTINDLII